MLYQASPLHSDKVFCIFLSCFGQSQSKKNEIRLLTDKKGNFIMADSGSLCIWHSRRTEAEWLEGPGTGQLSSGHICGSFSHHACSLLPTVPSSDTHHPLPPSLQPSSSLPSSSNSLPVAQQHLDRMAGNTHRLGREGCDVSNHEQSKVERCFLP